jgi:hypothetical protein
MIPVVGANTTVPLAVPPVLVITLLATGKKSSFDNTFTVLLPNGAVKASLAAVALVDLDLFRLDYHPYHNLRFSKWTHIRKYLVYLVVTTSIVWICVICGRQWIIIDTINLIFVRYAIAITVACTGRY